MKSSVPSSLGVIAGKGVYPRLLAESARHQGVSRIVAIAFKKETRPSISRVADETVWLAMGQLEAMLKVLTESGVRQVVMAGQITPTHLFRIRPDRRMLALLKTLHPRNAHTIFGAVCDQMEQAGLELLPASSFMALHMPEPGLLTRRAPTPMEERDIQLGRQVGAATSVLEIGQTVVIKEGVILAVEAFEGTDETLKRAGRLGGPGAVVVKTAKRGHDMRFDIPVVGEHTLRVMKKSGASALAVEAGRCIMLDRAAVLAKANRIGLCIVAVQGDAHADKT